MNKVPAKRSADPNGDAASAKKPKKSANEAKGREAKKEKPLNPEVELQQSLLRSDKTLSDRFIKAFQEKPESITSKQFARQFWTARAHLLRAHAVEREQKKANYNVLSQVKPQTVEGEVRVNITPEQVEDIFRQHPVLRKAYDDTVPTKYKTNMDFWSAFFGSRLFKKLKGERIHDIDRTDAILDQYLVSEDETRRGQQVAESHIPHFIDLEGNEQNHSQRKGNQADIMMRPTDADKVPILRVLNSMSEKIMAHTTPADGDPHGPIGMDEDTYNELLLRDLQVEAGADRVVLNIRSLHEIERGDKSDRSRSLKQLPQKALNGLLNGLQNARDESTSPDGHGLSGLTGLADIQDVDDDSDSDDEVDKGAVRPTQNSGIRHATTEIQLLISQQRERQSKTAVTSQLPLHTMQDLILTHHTSNEFLRFFWRLINNPQAPAVLEAELPPLLATLDKSLTRIEAIENVAEEERKARLMELKKQAVEAQKAGRRKVVNEKEAGPGKKEVQTLMAPMVRSIAFAQETFKKSMPKGTLKG